MAQIYPMLSRKIVCTSFVILSCFSLPLPNDTAFALTASIGQPYRGQLVNGIPFPDQFRGYQLRDRERSYATPELIGAVLDAIDKVLAKYPDSADLFIGDVSGPQGGRMTSHRSHENGRDIDLGMYAKGNRELNGFLLMNEENLDVPKTWELIENLLHSRRVQYIFLDSSINRLLYRYAQTQGVDQNYLEKLFGVGDSPDHHTVIQHLRNHRDHIHVRFFTPWSTLAGQLPALSEKQRGIIDLAQGAYLPKKVNYYAQGNETGLNALAASFGVTTKDLCRWNNLRGNEAIELGSCLVFYKRGFEIEPVRLAQSLQPNMGMERPVAAPAPPMARTPVTLAALEPKLEKEPEVTADVPASLKYHPARDRRDNGKPKVILYTVSRGQTLDSIAKQHKIDPETLCRLNGLRKADRLTPGRKIKLLEADTKPSSEPAKTVSTVSRDPKEKIKAPAIPARGEPRTSGRSSRKDGSPAPSSNTRAASGKGIDSSRQQAAPGKEVSTGKDKKSAPATVNSKTALVASRTAPGKAEEKTRAPAAIVKVADDKKANSKTEQKTVPAAGISKPVTTAVGTDKITTRTRMISTAKAR